MLLGQSWLRTPRDFAGAVRRVLDLAASLETDLALNLGAPRCRAVEIVDDFSNDLCKVLDASEVVRGNHVDAEWRREAERARVELSNLVHELNRSSALATALTRAQGSRGGRSREERRVLDNLQAEMVSLIPGNQVVEEKLDVLCERFIRNVRASPPPADLTSTSKSRRREAYFKTLQTPGENLSIVEDILGLRQTLAAQSGISEGGFAARALRVNSLAKSPSTAIDFLRDLSARVRPLARAQHLELCDFARSSGLSTSGRIEPWNHLHLERAARARIRSHGADAAVLSQYFSLGNCLRGIGLVLEETFGLRWSLEVVGERGEAEDEPWCPGLLRMTISEGEEDLGVVYLDLIWRGGKAKQNAHYVVQSPRREKESPGGAQRAVVVLSCAFGHRGAGHGSPTSHLLHPREVEVLFHEFGHALHTMLSLSSFHYLSGTRGECDFIEVPSTLFEKFALHPVCIRRYARHWQTEEPLPLEALMEWRAGETKFRALGMQEKIAFALSDQLIHGGEGDFGSAMDVGGVFVDQMEEHCLIPHARDTFPQLRFQHLVLYPGYYYSYLYAQCISAALWDDLFEARPLDRKSGALVRRLLARSAAEDPSMLLREFGNGKAYVSAKGPGSVPIIGRLF